MNVGGALAPRPSAVKAHEPHSKSLRIHRVMDRPDTFFVTKCIRPRRAALSEELRASISSAFRHAVKTQRITVGAFVVMPDHWHGLIGLVGGGTLPQFMHFFMSFVGAKTVRALHALGCRWQDGYYETRIRSAKQIAYVSDYIVWNPVRQGLVSAPEQWDATSLREPALVSVPWPWQFELD
jgi:putative transposase